MEELEYALLRTVPVGDDLLPVEHGAVNGGMLKREGPIQSPVITIGVEDLDPALRAVEANGGA